MTDMPQDDERKNISQSLTIDIETLRKKLLEIAASTSAESPTFQEDQLKKHKRDLRHKFFCLVQGITRWSCIYAALLVWIIITFASFLMCQMAYTYVEEVVKDPQALHHFLSVLWKIMSGAFVVGFIQLAFFLIKKNSTDD